MSERTYYNVSLPSILIGDGIVDAKLFKIKDKNVHVIKIVIGDYVKKAETGTEYYFDAATGLSISHLLKYCDLEEIKETNTSEVSDTSKIRLVSSSYQKLIKGESVMYYNAPDTGNQTTFEFALGKHSKFIAKPGKYKYRFYSQYGLILLIQTENCSIIDLRKLFPETKDSSLIETIALKNEDFCIIL